MNLYDILQSSFPKLSDKNYKVAAYISPNIPYTILNRSYHYFHIKKNKIIGVVDTSFFKHISEGFVFTMDAFYVKEFLRHSHKFLYKDIYSVNYFDALSTSSGERTVSININTLKSDFNIDNRILRKLNAKVLDNMLQQIISLYGSSNKKSKIQYELKQQISEIAHPENFIPHEFKKDDPQIYKKE